MSRCPNCMNELAHEKCTCCGYPAVEVAAIRGALPAETVLMNRFELGYALGASHQSIAYIAYDRQQGKAVIVLEFYPKQISVRKKQQVSPRSHQEMYMDACRRFLTSEQAMPMQLVHTFADNNTAYRVYQLKGSAVNAVNEADQLLDYPILFRNAEGKPVMAVNALPIPPMPETTAWTLSRKLTKERTRKKVNRLAVAALVGIMAVAAGIVYMDAIREYDVSVRVRTDWRIESAMLGDLALPEATPDQDGYVTYSASLRRGEYTFTAKNEQQMESPDTQISVGQERSEFDVVIPTATPAPISVDAEADEWLYAEDGRLFVVSGGRMEETGLKPADDVVLHSVAITANAMYTKDDSMQLCLARGGVEQPLVWTNGSIAFSVTDGDYELILHKGDWAHPVETLHVSADTAVELDMKAYQYYLNYLAELPESEKLYFIGVEPSIPGIFAGVSEINGWADTHASLFARYRQHEVAFELDEGLPERAVVTLNGYVWNPGDETSFCEGETMVDVVITVDNQVLVAESLPVNPTQQKVYTLGAGKAQEDLAKWQSVEGLMQHAGQHYTIGEDRVLHPLTAQEWAELELAMQIYSDRLNYKAHSVTLNIDSLAEKTAIRSVEILGLELTPSGEAEQPLTYQIDMLSEGSYEITVNFHHGDPIIEEVVVASDTVQKLLVKDAMEAMKIDGYLERVGVYGILRTADGDRFLYSSDEALELTPDNLFTYQERYPTQVTRWTMCPVHIGIDPMIDVSMIEGIYLDNVLIADGTISDPVSIEVTAGTHEVVVMPRADQEVRAYALEVTADAANSLTLLEEEARQAREELRYWGTEPDGLEQILGDAFWLKDEIISQIRSEVSELKLVIPEPWQHLAFALRLAGAEGSELALPLKDGVLTAYANQGQYELYVQPNGDEVQEAVLVSLINLSADRLLELEVPLKAEADHLARYPAMVELAVDERINPARIIVVTFSERSDISLLQKSDEERWVYKASDQMDYGEYVILVVLEGSEGSTGSLEYYYTLHIGDGDPRLTIGSDGDGEVTEKLLGDVAAEVTAGLRYWGVDRSSMTRLAGSEWLLTDAAVEVCKDQVRQITIRFPREYPRNDMQFELVSAESPDPIIFEKEAYLEDKQQKLYLSDGSYELKVRYTEYGKKNERLLATLIVEDELAVEEVAAGIIKVRDAESYELMDGYEGPAQINTIKAPSATRTPAPTAAPDNGDDNDGEGGVSSVPPLASPSDLG